MLGFVGISSIHWFVNHHLENWFLTPPCKAVQVRLPGDLVARANRAVASSTITASGSQARAHGSWSPCIWPQERLQYETWCQHRAFVTDISFPHPFMQPLQGLQSELCRRMGIAGIHVVDKVDATNEKQLPSLVADPAAVLWGSPHVHHVGEAEAAVNLMTTYDNKDFKFNAFTLLTWGPTAIMASIVRHPGVYVKWHEGSKKVEKSAGDQHLDNGDAIPSISLPGTTLEGNEYGEETRVPGNAFGRAAYLARAENFQVKFFLTARSRMRHLQYRALTQDETGKTGLECNNLPIGDRIDALEHKILSTAVSRDMHDFIRLLVPDIEEYEQGLLAFTVNDYVDTQGCKNVLPAALWESADVITSRFSHEIDWTKDPGLFHDWRFTWFSVGDFLAVWLRLPPGLCLPRELETIRVIVWCWAWCF